MRRVLNIAGSLLMLAGIGLLAYVGLTYARQRIQTAAPHWSSADRQKGRAIAAKLATPQRVAIPKRLRHRSGALPPPGEPAVRIVIPRIGVDAPVVETVPTNGTWQVADWAVGHLATTPQPGVPGNMALSAHDDIKGEIFKRLGELRPGDVVRIYTPHAIYSYIVFNQRAVDPSDVGVLDPTRNAVVTLISCTPYWVDTQRLIVQAALKSRRAI